MEAHRELVHAGIGVTGPTVKGTLGPHSNRKGGDLQVQAILGALVPHPGNGGGGIRWDPRGR